MSNPEGCLGRVLAVEGSEVCIGLASPLPKGPDRPTVGKFVAISGHETTLVGMISDVSLRAEAIDGSRTVARVDLLGEIERTPAGDRALPPRGPRVRRDRRPGPDDRQRRAQPHLRLDQRPGDHHRPPEPGPLDPGLRRHRPHARQAFRRRRLDRRRQVERRRLDPRQDDRGPPRAPRPPPRRPQRIPRRLRRPRQRHRRREPPPAVLALQLRGDAQRPLRRQARRGRGGRHPRRTDPGRQGEVPGPGRAGARTGFARAAADPAPQRLHRRHSLALPPAGPPRSSSTSAWASSRTAPRP